MWSFKHLITNSLDHNRLRTYFIRLLTRYILVILQEKLTLRVVLVLAELRYLRGAHVFNLVEKLRGLIDKLDHGFVV